MYMYMYMYIYIYIYIYIHTCIYRVAGVVARAQAARDKDVAQQIMITNNI